MVRATKQQERAKYNTKNTSATSMVITYEECFDRKAKGMPKEQVHGNIYKAVNTSHKKGLKRNRVSKVR